jgi:methionyl-tRNA synthetase
MKYYITTTLPYVNADPHIGFALEIVQADVLARWRSQMGDEVLFNTGTDEHGQKIYQCALDKNQTPQEYCDYYAGRFVELKKSLNLSYTNFIRTTDECHIKAAQEFWKICLAKGDIYKKQYSTKYCVGCELEKTDSELVEGKCPIHPNKDIELREEENYFFKFSNYQQKLLDLYNTQPDFVVPVSRLKEVKSFVEGGLQDFSISRLKSKMPWGVPVPDDEAHVMYVWFDALVNYISTINWPNEDYLNWWPGVQVAGKDNLRQQSAMWQAMLMSAGVATSKQIFIHGFMTKDGQKISKSTGNTVDPLELVEKYGTDAVRYYLLKAIHPYEDSDFSITSFETLFNSDLANGLGNLVSRVAGLVEKLFDGKIERQAYTHDDSGFKKDFDKCLTEFRFDEAIKLLQLSVYLFNKRVGDEKSWDVYKTDKNEAAYLLSKNIDDIMKLIPYYSLFIPETAEKIKTIFDSEEIRKPEPLFKRVEVK